MQVDAIANFILERVKCSEIILVIPGEGDILFDLHDMAR